MSTIERLRALLDGLPPSWPVTRLGHAPHCGDGAEFPWDCTCDLPDFREDLEKAINGLPALLDVAEAVQRMSGSGVTGDQDEDPTDFWFALNDAIAALARLDAS